MYGSDGVEVNSVKKYVWRGGFFLEGKLEGRGGERSSSSPSW